MSSTDEASSEPASIEAVATVFTVSLDAVLFEFSPEGSAADAEPQIGYVPPNKIRVGNRLIPGTVRKVETLARYVDAGDELRVKVVRVAEADRRTIAYTEEGEEGDQVEIQPEWVAVECEKTERLGSPTATAAPPSTPSTPAAAGGGKKRVSSSSAEGKATPTARAAAGQKGKTPAKRQAAKEVEEGSDAGKQDNEEMEMKEEEENKEEGSQDVEEEEEEEEEVVEIIEEAEDNVENITADENREVSEQVAEEKEEEVEGEGEKGANAVDDFVLELDLSQDDDFAVEAKVRPFIISLVFTFQDRIIAFIRIQVGPTEKNTEVGMELF
jgi:hypothetical protein